MRSGATPRDRARLESGFWRVLDGRVGDAPLLSGGGDQIGDFRDGATVGDGPKHTAHVIFDDGVCAAALHKMGNKTAGIVVQLAAGF